MGAHLTSRKKLLVSAVVTHQGLGTEKQKQCPDSILPAPSRLTVLPPTKSILGSVGREVWEVDLVSVDLRASEVSQCLCTGMVKTSEALVPSPLVCVLSKLDQETRGALLQRVPWLQGTEVHPHWVHTGIHPCSQGCVGQGRSAGFLGLVSIWELALVLPSSSEPIGCVESVRDFLKRSVHHSEVHSKRKKTVFISRVRCLHGAVRLQLAALSPTSPHPHSVPDNQS